MNPVMYVYERHQEPVRKYAAKCIILENPEYAIEVLREAGMLDEVEVIRIKLKPHKDLQG